MHTPLNVYMYIVDFSLIEQNPHLWMKSNLPGFGTYGKGSMDGRLCYSKPKMKEHLYE